MRGGEWEGLRGWMSGSTQERIPGQPMGVGTRVGETSRIRDAIHAGFDGPLGEVTGVFGSLLKLMKNIPKCSKCQTEMEVGYIIDRAHHNTRAPATWVEGEPEPSFWTGTKISGKEQHQVNTFRCPGCGFLESYAP